MSHQFGPRISCHASLAAGKANSGWNCTAGNTKWRLVFLISLLAAVVGCGPKTRLDTVEVPAAPVSHPAQREVTDYVDYTGRTQAVQSVNIIARVTGYLTQIPFTEGSEVKAGDLLFKIDPRPYEAQYDQADSQVKLDEAQLDLAKTTLDRYKALAKTQPGAVSEQALDQYKAAVAEAEARVVAQKKSLEIYSLNKEFTRVVSPIDGQVSRYYLTLGNLVNQDQTLLTTVVSLDPIYVYFDMDEATRLRILELIEKGKIAPPAEGDMQVRLGLQDEEDYPHTATVDFTNNQVNSTTGSITMRAKLRNPPLVPGRADAGGEKGSSCGEGPDRENGAALGQRFPSRGCQRRGIEGLTRGKGFHPRRRRGGAAGPAAIYARHVRARPGADRPTAPGPAGH